MAADNPNSQEEFIQNLKTESLQHTDGFIKDYEIPQHFSFNDTETKIFTLAFATELLRFKSEQKSETQVNFTPTDRKTEVLIKIPPVKWLTNLFLKKMTGSMENQIIEMENSAYLSMKNDLENLRPTSDKFVKIVPLAQNIAIEWLKLKGQDDVPQFLEILNKEADNYNLPK